MIANTTSSSIESESKDIWIIDDDRSIRWVLEKALAKQGWNITTFESGDAALRAYRNCERCAHAGY
jgi:DNA-binding NtrC family response regulator